ncbi:MAG: Ig-like domain-containing protein [Thermoplasmata archaeon]|nr:MAG: Ig-like domain-containing protein [Thermoplasmata archaeon]
MAASTLAVLPNNGASGNEPVAVTENTTSGFENGIDSAPENRAPTSESSVAQWHTEIITASDDSMNNIAVGDFMTTGTGQETVVTLLNTADSITEFVLVSRSSEGDWDLKDLFQTDSALVDLASGELRADSAGSELVFISNDASGTKGTLTMTMPDQQGGAWPTQMINEFSKPVNVMAAGDILHTQEGMEIVTADNDNTLFISYLSSEGNWETSEIETVEGNIIDIIICDLDPDEPGNQLLIIDDVGNVIQKSDTKISENTLWTSNTLWTQSSAEALTAVTAGDADNDGNIEILVGLANNKLVMLDRGGDGSWVAKNVFVDKAPIRTISIADIDPFHSGFETISAGDSKSLTALYHKVGAWTSRILHTDSNNIVDIYAGLVDISDFAGNDIITVNGDGGQLRLVAFSGFYSETLWTGDNKLSGVTIGDLDTSHDGNEVVVVGMNKDLQGIATMAYRGNSGDWKSESLFTGHGELLTPVIGDFDDETGNELAIVGMLSGPEGVGLGQATMIKKSSGKWEDQRLFVNPKLLHGAAIGELMNSHSGPELVVVGFAFNVTILTKDAGNPGGDWDGTHVWQSVHNVRKAVFADVDSTHAGEELFVVDKSGNLTMIYEDGTSWHVETLWTDPGTPGLARLAIGDADNDGKNEIVVGGDSKNIGIIEQKDNGEWIGKVLWTDENKIRGCAIGDFDFNHAGNEIAVYGYSMKVTMLTLDENNEVDDKKTIFTDIGRGHDLAVGEFDNLHEGNELLLSGYSRNLTMVAFYDDITPPAFSISSPKTTGTVIKGSSVIFNITVDSTGNFNELVNLELDSLPAGISVKSFQSQSLIGQGTAQLELTVSSTFAGESASFNVKASGAGMTESLSFTLSITEKDQPGVVSVSPEADSKGVKIKDLVIELEFDTAIYDSSVTFTIISDKNGKYTGTVEWSDDKKTLMIKDIYESDNKIKKLPEDSKITVTVNLTGEDENGDFVEVNHSWEFETGEEEEDAGAFEGMGLAIGILIIIIVIIVVVGIMVGRKKPTRAEEPPPEEDRKKPTKGQELPPEEKPKE